MTHNLCWRDIWFDPVNYYEIDEAGNVTTTSTELPAPVIYESTNGSVYVILKSQEKNKKGVYVSKPYKIDMLVLWVFARDAFAKAYIREDDSKDSVLFIDIIHKDGNQLNNHISNLEAKRPEEVWIPLEYKDVEKGRYEISTFGRIRQKKKGEWVIVKIQPHSDPDGYQVYSLTVFPRRNPKYSNVNMRKHIIVASCFVANPNPELYTQVNHINGCKTDNSLCNLEWVSPYMNTRHAIECNLSPNQPTLTTAEIDMVRDMLLDQQYKGSPVKIYGAINKKLHPNISQNIIYSIKSNNRAYVRADSKYGTDPIDFPKCKGHGRVSYLTQDLTDMLDKMYRNPIYMGTNGKVNKEALWQDFKSEISENRGISRRMVFTYLCKYN